jgi:O-antigen/teichoic acid export membrane protein
VGLSEPDAARPEQDAETWTPITVVRKSVQGVLALGVRQVLVQGLNLTGAVLLARILSPAEFGMFAIITFILSFLLAFGDAGLGASLIREPNAPAEEDYRAVFTAQQALVVAVVVTSWVAAPWAARAYGLPAEHARLFRLVALSLLFTSFQVIPSIRLERHLGFNKLAIVETGMALVFNGSAVAMALMGFGAFSFAWALLFRSVAGAVLAYAVSPWLPRWHWQWELVRRHLSFGIPYQGFNFVCLLKDSMNPVFIGILLGPAQVGYINWALMVSAAPGYLLMVLRRVYLPAFSRMQDHPESLRQFVEQVIRASNALYAPIAVLTLALIEPITRIVFGAKWLTAIPLFYLFWVGSVFSPTSVAAISLLNAVGRSRVPFIFVVIRTVTIWVIGAPLVLLLGSAGYALADCISTPVHIYLFRRAQGSVRFRILSTNVPQWAWAGAVGLGASAVSHRWSPAGPAGLAVQLGVAFGIYFLGLIAFYPATARKAWGWIRSEGWSLAFR